MSEEQEGNQSMSEEPGTASRKRVVGSVLTGLALAIIVVVLLLTFFPTTFLTQPRQEPPQPLILPLADLNTPVPTGSRTPPVPNLQENGPYEVAGFYVLPKGHGVLNLGAPYPNHTMTIFVPAAALPKIKLWEYNGKTIMVKGVIEQYKGKPQIKVIDPEQIRIVP